MSCETLRAVVEFVGCWFYWTTLASVVVLAFLCWFPTDDEGR